MTSHTVPGGTPGPVRLGGVPGLTYRPLRRDRSPRTTRGRRGGWHQVNGVRSEIDSVGLKCTGGQGTKSRGEG